MRTKLMVLAAALVLLAGCQTPMQKLAVAEQSLISTGRLLITARKADLLTYAEWQEVKKITERADEALDLLRVAVFAGEDIRPALRTFNKKLDELIELRATAARRKKGGG